MKPDEEKAETEANEIYFEVEQLIDEQNAGEQIDWTITNPELYPLLELWRRTEREMENIRAQKLINLFEHQNEILKAGLKVTVN